MYYNICTGQRQTHHAMYKVAGTGSAVPML
jgi:hypothetical protein